MARLQQRFVEPKPLRGHSCDRSRTRSSHCFAELPGERHVRFHSVGSRDENYDREGKRGHVLLVFQILVSRHEDIERAASAAEQFPVPHGLPPLFWHSDDIVSLEQPFQAARKGLI